MKTNNSSLPLIPIGLMLLAALISIISTTVITSHNGVKFPVIQPPSTTTTPITWPYHTLPDLRNVAFPYNRSQLTKADELKQRLTTERIVIHHSGSDQTSIASMKDWHTRHNGWSDIGYHFVINQDGQLVYGRDMRAIGAHDNYQGNDLNPTSVGICLVGNSTFTDAQKITLTELLTELCQYYKLEPVIGSDPYRGGTICRHHEKCPGKNLDLANIMATVRQALTNKK